jgi:hypothetical protein
MRPEWRTKRNVIAAGTLGLTLALGLAMADARAAVTDQDFLVATTGNLADLCKATTTDPVYTAAVNFCHGFTVGVYRVLEAENRAKSTHIFCAPQQMPTRTEAIAAFVRWVDAHPDERNLRPVDGMAAYLQQQFPCGRRR